MQHSAPMRAFLLIGVVLLGAACAHSPECKKRLDNCLRHCPPQPPSIDRQTDSEIRGTNLVDQRSDCERRCQLICVPTRDRGTEPIEPATGPTTP